jgi:hypothetical protein
VALRARRLKPRVRSGIESYIRALDLEVRFGHELYQAALSRYINPIKEAFARMRYALAVADQAITFIHP